MARVPIANSTEVYTPPLKPTRDQVGHVPNIWVLRCSILTFGIQAVVLYVIAVYLVIIFACWSMPGARRIINPFKVRRLTCRNFGSPSDPILTPQL
jgi:hypothetical protein